MTREVHPDVTRLGPPAVSASDRSDRLQGSLKGSIVNPKKLETGLRTNSAGIPYTLLLRIEAIGFPTFGLLLYYP